MPVLLSFSYSIISIHALLAESDEFQSVGIAHLFISIHALLAESDRQSGALPQPPPHISIHALLAESDLSGLFHTRVNKISIHALLAESDFAAQRLVRRHAKFLSTLSLRRATSRLSAPSGATLNFYPRSPCGERPTQAHGSTLPHKISIHALLAESDQIRPFRMFIITNFYPRSPCGERQVVPS